MATPPDARFHEQQTVTTIDGYTGKVKRSIWNVDHREYDVIPDGRHGPRRYRELELAGPRRYRELELAPGDGTGPYAVWGRNGQRFSETLPSAAAVFRLMREARPELRAVIEQVGGHVAPADWPNGWCPGCLTERTDRNQASGEYIAACPVCRSTDKPVDRDTLEALIEWAPTDPPAVGLDPTQPYRVDVRNIRDELLAKVVWEPDRPGTVQAFHVPGIGSQRFTADEARLYAAALEQAAALADGLADEPTAGVLERLAGSEAGALDTPNPFAGNPDRTVYAPQTEVERSLRRAELRRRRVAERERPVCICRATGGARPDCPRHGTR